MGDFSSPDTSWEYHTASTKRSRKFLKHIEVNLLVQVLRELTKKGALLDQRGSHGWSLAALAMVTMKQSSLKSMVMGEKLPANLQQIFNRGYAEIWYIYML